jgi:hypothetical protein
MALLMRPGLAEDAIEISAAALRCQTAGGGRFLERQSRREHGRDLGFAGRQTKQPGEHRDGCFGMRQPQALSKPRGTQQMRAQFVQKLTRGVRKIAILRPA